MSLLDLESDLFINSKQYVVDKRTVIIIECVLLFREPINHYFHQRVFLDIGFDTVLKRATMRDVPKYGELILDKYRNKYIPAQQKYFSKCSPKERSDFVIDNTDFNRPYIKKVNKTKHVIHILGASGAGTTTLGKAMCDVFGYMHLDTDDYFWQQTDPPFTKKTPREERQRLLGRDIARYDKCVISGTLDEWGDIFIPLFNLVIYVYTPTETRIERLKHREYQRFGDRILPGGDMHDNHRDFIEWSARYDTADLEQRSHKLHMEWLKKVTCPIIKVDGTRPTNELLKEINAVISTNTIGGRYCD